jgi:diguanylate cyclase (GGDEF)-like protein
MSATSIPPSPTSAHPMPPPPPLRRGPLEWSPVDRCLLVGAITVPFLIAYWAMGESVLAHPEREPFFDFRALLVFQRLLGGYVLGWLALMGAELATRRHARDPRSIQSRVFVHATIQLYAIGNTAGAMSFGAVTSPHAFILLGGAAVALVLFDRRAVGFGLLSALVVVAIATWLTSTGRMHYAPILAGPPYVDGEISTTWVLQMTVVEVCVATALLSLFAYLVRRLRDREARLVWISTTDALTGIANRRHFIDLFDTEFERARRYGTTLACVVIDLDHSKRVNDKYGHLAGDRVLATAARIFREQIRTHDVLARWGGEEFVALLPQTDLPGAEAVAERCRATLEKTSIDLADGVSIRVTASLGIACHPFPAAKSGEDLLHRADTALYAAKESGRNRMHSIPPSAPRDSSHPTS